ncbi:mucin-binding protein, partial [Lactobacillus crispatus]|uniref:mucin-binding protein n=1 Tax=Lactobacillus crispatus TaxID=47770 RepID=UPI0014732C38
VHVKHKHEQVNRSVTYERTVNFVDETGKQMADPEKQNLTFNQTGDKDLATDMIKWAPVDSQSFEEVAAKNIAGYTSDKQAISAETVAPSDSDFSEAHTENLKITYKADPQTVKVVYVDDDNNGSQIGDTQTVSGVTDETVSTNISNPDSTKYEIVDADKLPETVTLKPNDETVITVHLKHKHTQVNRSVTYERTVNFVDETGKQMADPEKQTLTFNQTGDKDLAAGTIKWVPVDSQSFEEVAAKNVAGYTSDKQAISAETVMPSDGDFSKNHTENLKITYKADPQTVKVVYVDDDNNSSQIGNTQTVSGVTDETVSTNISNPDPTKYEIVDGDKLPETVTLKPDDDRVVTVHLKHKHTQVNRSVTYERTVNFVDETGKQMADPEKQTLTFNQTGDKDLAAGTIKWVPVDSQSFEEVAAKNVAGYTSDKQAISAETVMPSDGDFSKNHTENLKITYKADPQTVKVVYVDDDNNSSQIGNTQTVSGVTDETVSTNISNPDSTKYEIVDGDKLPETVTLKPDDETVIKVHVKHKLADTNRTLKTTRTIVYVNEQGKQMADPVNQTLIFTQTGKKDLVTGEITWDPDYTQSLTWKAVTSPQIAGYTPDLTKVDEQTETVKDADFTKGHDQMV